MQLLKVHQIFFQPVQAGRCEREYLLYFNNNCNEYFENQVICDLVSRNEHKYSEYFGVVSYKLRDKIGSVMKERWKSQKEITNYSEFEFTPQIFENELKKEMPDVKSFQRHMAHDPILIAERYHPNFRKYWEHIMAKIGMNWKPTHLENVIYCNFFVAKSEIYERYVTEMLIPAMKIMSEMPELWGNSGYPVALNSDLSAKLGVNWYTYHAFLCERMPSWYIYVNGLNCKHF